MKACKGCVLDREIYFCECGKDFSVGWFDLKVNSLALLAREIRAKNSALTTISFNDVLQVSNAIIEMNAHVAKIKWVHNSSGEDILATLNNVNFNFWSILMGKWMIFPEKQRNYLFQQRNEHLNVLLILRKGPEL